MTPRYIERYTYHLIASVPLVVLLASSLSFSNASDDLCVTTQDSRYLAVGEQTTLTITVDADEPINTISGIVHIPTESVHVDTVTNTPSILDLWSEVPTFSEGGATLRFAGGTTKPGGFTGRGVVLTFTVTPRVPGEATIRFEEAHLFAHDGTGREVSCATGPITFSVRATTTPSPDVNGDARVDLFDLGTISTRIFLAYDRTYDLNVDGKVGIDDLVLMLRHIRNGTGALASLALLWN